jgi:aminoglycoside phosphotransferase (APT) family kinase protein
MAEIRLASVTTHGDFHQGNVLISGGAAWVVDWELSGHGPAGSDLLLFASTVNSPEDRKGLLEAAAELAGDRGEALRLAYAVLVRATAAKLSAAQPFDRDPEGAKRLLALLPAARQAAGF